MALDREESERWPPVSNDALRPTTEHRDAVLSSLLDGAQRILLDERGRRLTAAAVAAEAGIARNSIYRYVGSIDDLVEMVLARGFQEWAERVAADVAAAADPRAAVVAYVRSNLSLAAGGDHALHTAIAREGLSDSTRTRIASLHQQISRILEDAVAALDVADPALVVATVQALVDVAVAQIVPGDGADRTIEFMERATASIVSDARP